MADNYRTAARLKGEDEDLIAQNVAAGLFFAWATDLSQSE